MHKRSLLHGSWIVVLVLGVFWPAAAVTASTGLPATMISVLHQIMPGDALTLSAQAAPARTSKIRADVPYRPIPLRASCASACLDLYDSCLNDCAIAPFPGCADFCRFDVLYPCYKSCF